MPRDGCRPHVPCPIHEEVATPYGTESCRAEAERSKGGEGSRLDTPDPHTFFSPSLCSLAEEALSELPSGGACLAAGLGLLLADGRRLADCRTASECSRAFMRRAATLAVRLLWQP